MKKKDFVHTVPQSIRIPVLEKTSLTLPNAEGPVSLLCSPEEDWQSFIIHELLPKLAAISHPNELLYFNPQDIGKSTLLNSFSNLFTARLDKKTEHRFNSTDPTDWSLSLRSIMRYSNPNKYYLVIDGLEHVLSYPVNEQHKFSTLVSHIACEPNLNVLAIFNKAQLQSIRALPGFAHLTDQSDPFSAVPNEWQLPPFPIPIRNKKHKAHSLLSSNLMLSSAVVVSMASISAAFWVANRMNSNFPTVASRTKMIRPENRAAMRSLSVASAKEIEWGRPSANRQTLNQELMNEPIPVAFDLQHSHSIQMLEPTINGKLAEKIDIEAIDAYHSQVFKELDTKSILSFQPLPDEEKFFATEHGLPDLPAPE